MTARDLTPSMLTEIVADEVRPILLFEGQFASGYVRLWTGFGSVSWDGKTWTGAGHLIGVSEIAETSDIVAAGITVSFSGVDPSLVSAAISEARQGMPGKIWVGLLDDTGAIIADPYLAFTGRLDVPEISDGENQCTITIAYESRLIDLNRTREWRYTHESQQVLYPGDLGLEYVAAIQDLKITWGQPSQAGVT
jgi:hypothetical protein